MELKDQCMPPNEPNWYHNNLIGAILIYSTARLPASNWSLPSPWSSTSSARSLGHQLSYSILFFRGMVLLCPRHRVQTGLCFHGVDSRLYYSFQPRHTNFLATFFQRDSTTELLVLSRERVLALLADCGRWIRLDLPYLGSLGQLLATRRGNQ